MNLNNGPFMAAAWKIVDLYCRTWRYEVVNPEIYDNLASSGKKFVIAIWHDQLLPATFLHRFEGITTIASDSKDGDLITYALDRWGYRTARGSSTRGGVKAALGAIKTSREFGSPCAVTVDGPKGPRHTVKEGAALIAKKLDGIVIAGAVSCRTFKRFSSWDGFILPAPFAKIRITYSSPFYVSSDESGKGIKKDTEALQKFMTEFTREASPFFI